ncbi:Hypothetical_protein [Hexamita inflata]|uniref:Hypothetical_protein n=1 Tax=Hexamita inflata TaxID=28002 RepID=A0AA86UUZ3_9EUKA|nr:Hypothetical protein HINF_LOCUS38133 [Hexamita inflata]CAI9950490.1 Hypothetical protein HINF_LOCUS38135 [Hexamita inflata]CAI9950492.1 Hypothetical protein HINF_LOCUS38137 [Hexamita inflata]
MLVQGQHFVGGGRLLLTVRVFIVYVEISSIYILQTSHYFLLIKQLCVFIVGQFLISRQGCGFKCLCAHGFLLSKQTYNCCKKHQTTVILQIAGCDGFQIQYEANGRTSRNVKTDENALVLNMFQIYSLDTVEARQTPSHAVMLVQSLWRDANRTYVVPTKDSKCA